MPYFAIFCDILHDCDFSVFLYTNLAKFFVAEIFVSEKDIGIPYMTERL